MLAQAAKYKRLHSDEYKSEPCMRLKFRNYALSVSGFTCLVFIFCVCYSLVYNFDSSTSTGCGAYNVLPSISAAIGGYSPQKEVWKIAISLTFIPRVLLIRDYVLHYIEVCQEKSFLIPILALLNFVENCALISLSFYDSTHDYSMHKKSFITFVLTSELYMLLLIYFKSRYSLSGSELFGLKLKKLLALINICGILLAMYYFIDHNRTCKDFVYTKFALSEYVVVFSNIAFHTTIIYEFPHRSVIFGFRHLIKIETSTNRSKTPLIMEA